jgi:hypothetical protein
MKPGAFLALAIALVAGASLVFGAKKANESEAKTEVIQGCLDQPAASVYTLTIMDLGQKVYILTGNTAELATHVGHTIAVNGDIVVKAVATYGVTSVDRTGGWRAIGSDASNNTGTIEMKDFSDISTFCDWKK